MTYIVQSGGGDTKGYLMLTTSSSPAGFQFLHSSYKSSYVTTVNNGDWDQDYASSNVDSVYLKDNVSWVLKANRKVLVEFQFNPAFDMTTSNDHIKLRIGLHGHPTSSANHNHARSGLILPTYHWENDSLFGYTDHKESVYRAIIENTQSAEKTITIYLDQDSDSSFTANSNFMDSASKLKFTQLD